MFLTKNHTHYFDKPLTKVTSPRTLPDWNDTDSEEDYQEVPPVSSINYQYANKEKRGDKRRTGIGIRRGIRRGLTRVNRR